jgi:predicted TIM-barrel fold metal-dependent hydrolase
MTVAVSLTAGGVFERFPKLRVALLEGNCSWAPWLLTRLDEHYEWVGHYEAPELRRKPSEYFRSNCFLSVEADEETATQYVDWFGDENLVFSTDYPHADSKYPHAVETFLKLPISDQSKRKILWDNWGRMYDIPLGG